MTLDPQVKYVLDAMAARKDPPYEDLSPPEARAAFLSLVEVRKRFGYVPEPVKAVESRTVATADGPLPVRIFRPEGEGPHPIVVMFHGGGWVLGSSETHEMQARPLCRRSGAVVVSVDYRLAPEHPFPAALDDAYAATAWAFEHAEELDADPSRLAVMGDSAGANLAAGVCLLARDRGGPTIAGQVLVVPSVDATLSHPSVTEFAEGYGLTAATMRWFVDHYLPDHSQRAHPLASPLAAEDLSGLPPAVIMTAEYDPLRDEGEAYAERLRAAGVRVELDRRAGLTHGFVGMAWIVAAAESAVDDLCEKVRELLAG